MDELYLDNIDEYINDQNKIVTYKWLSLTLGVHVNTAKQMLYHYLEQRRRETSGTTLHATYLVSGKCMENGNMCHKVSVVREDKLEDMKSRLDVTVSVHVYSVQKAELKDSAPLYSTDYDAVKENLMNCSRYSSIRCTAAVPMSSAELKRVQKEAVIAVTERETSKINPNNSTAPPPKSSSKQPKGIMGMFANKAGSKSQEQNREVKAEQKDEAPSNEVLKSKAPAKAKAMNNFFGKSTEKKTAAVKTEKKVKEETEEAAKLPQTLSKSQHEGDGVKEEKLNKTTGVNKDAKDTRSKTKRLEHSDSDEEKEESQKKRRRIKKPKPDSSDDDDDDEVIPDSPPVPEVRTPSPKKQVKKEPEPQQNSEGKRRKRRRVLKSRTFLDDDDCMVTEKGYESESYSESDDDFKSATKTSEGSGSLKPSLGRKDERKAPEKTQKKAAASASNKATKQASIMGFFQKK